MDKIKEAVIAFHNEVVAKIDEYNAAMRKNDLDATKSAENALKDAEAAYAEAKCIEVFEELKKNENPVKAAIALHSYHVLSHRPTKEEGVTTGFELVEDKVRQIDLVRFCKHCKLPVMWQYAVEKFNHLLALRAATELKMTKSQIEKIRANFYMSDFARKVEMGETPASNTAICKQLQQVLDGIIFEDNGNGKNIYRVNNHDVAYILMSYTKRGKKKLSVAVSKNAYMHRLVLDVANRIITGGKYDLEYKISNKGSAVNEKPEAKNAENPTQPKAAETVVVEKLA